MDTKNIVIIILICAIVALSTYFLTVNMLMNQNQTNQSVNTTNNTTNIVNVEKVSQEDQSSSSSASSGSSKSNDNYVRDSNGNIMYAHTDAPGADGSYSVPMTKDGHYSYKATDEPNSPSGYWVDKS